ncbi:MAG TPA: dihydrolipoamide acetyltransferase family protein [Candidatus Limnocylindrales bacterium]|nr:dihydrolipoamide acetyltransferase family protein [Candidatus Limnocylindrales bacterium]
MAVTVIMPKLGMAMQEGTIVSWLVKEGDKVEKESPLAQIESEKVEYEVTAPESGIVRKILAPEGSVVPVGKTIAVITAENEALDEAAFAPTQLMAEAAKAVETKAVEEIKPEVAPKKVEPEERQRISPAARNLAKELGVDLSTVVGTGPGGRIVREDILRAAESKQKQPPGPLEYREVIPLKGMRKVIAERMAESWANSPRVTQIMEADMTETVKLREQKLAEWEREHGVRVTYNDMIIKATALALLKYPIMNSTITEGEIRIFKNINIGMAVALEDGLIVPVIRDADRKTLFEIARETKDLSEKARTGKLTPDELLGGTFTITNLGGLGVEIFTPIINYPQNAILGVGKITEMPVVRNGGIHIRWIMKLCVVYNHRAVSGAPVARFTQEIIDILEAPLKLI